MSYHEEMSYAADHRVRAGEDRDWYAEFDERAMVAKVWIVENPETGDEVLVTTGCKWEVCPTCDGKGTHVNPSIDCHGLSAEDFAEDPDFADEYFSGRYDEPCRGCNSRRVVLRPTNPAVIADRQAKADFRAQCEAEIAAERRMGA